METARSALTMREIQVPSADATCKHCGRGRQLLLDEHPTGGGMVARLSYLPCQCDEAHAVAGERALYRRAFKVLAACVAAPWIVWALGSALHLVQGH